MSLVSSHSDSNANSDTPKLFEPTSDSVEDDRYLNFYATFSGPLAKTIGQQYVSAASSAMFADLPERFKNCFQVAPSPLPTAKSTPEADHLRRLKSDLEALKKPKDAPHPNRPRPITHSADLTQPLQILRDLHLQAANADFGDESESENSDTEASL
jgi:hypothetical protein